MPFNFLYLCRVRFTMRDDHRLRGCFQLSIFLLSKFKLKFTYSLPVQKLEASLANQVTTPRSSSGRPSRPIGFNLDHFSSNSGCLSRYAAVILPTTFVQYTMLCANKQELTRCKCAQGITNLRESSPRPTRKPCYVPFEGQQICSCYTGPKHDP